MEDDHTTNTDELEEVATSNGGPIDEVANRADESFVGSEQESLGNVVDVNQLETIQLEPSISTSSSFQHSLNPTLDAIPEQVNSQQEYGNLPTQDSAINYPTFEAEYFYDQNEQQQQQPQPQPQPPTEVEAYEYRVNQGNFMAQPSDQIPIYSTVNKRQHQTHPDQTELAAQDSPYGNLPYEPKYSQTPSEYPQQSSDRYNPADYQGQTSFLSVEGDETKEKPPVDQANIENLDVEIGRILSRHKQGAVESGSFKNNFKKKLPSSTSSTDNELSVHRQKLLESQDVNTGAQFDEVASQSSNQMMKRNPSVSFNVGSSSRAGSRVSVDIRNLPSYLTGKRASIVDVARGAVMSLLHMGSGAGSSSSSHRRNSASSRSPSPESSSDDEPIFEEPIAPTLSLGQRVAWVSNDGPEFGTVGWIGQLPDVDDDWIVGVIFDNMIGDCDGQYMGVRYFYSRENYAMFLPLSALTKTDNYIGRPETGTMLSRMSVSLKPGQLISIQRSSIRLQHCFLNAPHQRVGHDVRAVSNRLHCQCHTCGPCAHLTKQGQRMTVLPHFGAHHVHHDRKKNSLAQAAIELFAHHHHHHFHEDEEPHEHEDHRFGDNSAHACNFVRYSCCQQSGIGAHDFLADCEMVRPELLDNLIHAPRAPHRRSRLRRAGKGKRSNKMALNSGTFGGRQSADDEQAAGLQEDLQKSDDAGNEQQRQNASWLPATSPEIEPGHDGSEDSGSYSSYSSASSSSKNRDDDDDDDDDDNDNDNEDHNEDDDRHRKSNYRSSSHYRSELTNYRQDNNMYNTIDSHISLVDQRRFIQQRDSSAMLQSHVSFHTSDDSLSTSRGFGSSIRRCLSCFWARSRSRRDDRGKRRGQSRKMSARNRLIEYRRKQSTFVPSTLAKPQDDFASHGISLPGYEDAQNINDQTYCNSACSHSSSGSQSDHNSPYRGHIRFGEFGNKSNLSANYMTFGPRKDGADITGGNNNDMGYKDSYELMKCSLTNDSFEDDFNSAKKSCTYSLTDPDLGYFDTYNTSNSNDTLKQIVDQSINDQVAIPELATTDELCEINYSPALSSSLIGDESNRDEVEVSSPTVSVQDQSALGDCDEQISEMMGRIDLQEAPESGQPSNSHDELS